MTVKNTLVCGKTNKCKNYNILAFTDVKMVENFSKKMLTFRALGYNIILILYIDRMRGDV